MLAINLILNFCIIGVFLFFYFKNYFKAVYLALTLPGPPATPIFGNALAPMENKFEEYALIFSKKGCPIARIWTGPLPVFIPLEPEYLRLILGSTKRNQKSFYYNLFHNYLGDGLVTISGEKWKLHRRLVQPYFNINFLKVYFDTFQTCSVWMVKEMEGKTDLNITELSNEFAFNVMDSVVMGKDVINDNNWPYKKIKMPKDLSTIFKITHGLNEESKYNTAAKKRAEQILDMKKQTIKTKLLDLLTEISQKNPEFTKEDVIDEASTFLIAGQDTVAAALVFCLYFLAKNQKCQVIAIDEINKIFRDNHSVTYEDITEMKYLEQCIKETLRLCPSAPLFSRRLTDDLTLGKVTLPAGSNIAICPFITHRLEKYFPDPLKFDPERFSPENKEKIHPYAYIPFSAGPRQCIAYKFALIQLKTVLCEILRKYHISLSPGHEELHVNFRFTLKAKKGVWLRLSKRNNQQIISEKV